jgi:leader peptidase (prepilin peptidase) / N-methyltransferase
MGDDLMSTTADVPSVSSEASTTAAVRSVRMPPALVAVVAIGMAAAALIKFDLSGRAFVAALYCVLLVVLAAIDLERRIIPNRIVVPGAFIVLLGNVAAEPHRAKEWTIAAFATMLGALVISVATRGGVGMGDVKLALLLGAGLGWNIVGAIVLAMGATFVVSLTILARRGLGARKETIPFGPFLVFGALVALLLS